MRVYTGCPHSHSSPVHSIRLATDSSPAPLPPSGYHPITPHPVPCHIREQTSAPTLKFPANTLGQPLHPRFPVLSLSNQRSAGAGSRYHFAKWPFVGTRQAVGAEPHRGWARPRRSSPRDTDSAALATRLGGGRPVRRALHHQQQHAAQPRPRPRVPVQRAGPRTTPCGLTSHSARTIAAIGPAAMIKLRV